MAPHPRRHPVRVTIEIHSDAALNERGYSNREKIGTYDADLPDGTAREMFAKFIAELVQTAKDVQSASVAS